MRLSHETQVSNPIESLRHTGTVHAMAGGEAMRDRRSWTSWDVIGMLTGVDTHTTDQSIAMDKVVGQESTTPRVAS